MANHVSMSRVTRWTVLLSAAVVVVMTSPAAHAAIAAAGPGAFAAGFATPVVVTAEGEAITFLNIDVAPHNFVASEAFLPRKAEKKAPWCTSYDAGKCPLFWSPTLAAGESAEVQGLERLRSGKQYAFFCSLHPGSMRGTLIVR